MSTTFPDLKMRRLKLRMTQAELGQKAGVHRVTVRNAERGENISQQSYVSLSDVLHQMEQGAERPDADFGDEVHLRVSAALAKEEASDWQKVWEQCDGSSLACESVAAERDYLRRELDRLRVELRNREVTW